ncbi:MAG TPA: hypothetical protein VNB49_11325, partial [Candidatus Dormibacteraeota bacterium]|nr:hypothetical protein [Candidatus Dormibacteraeota bacterium]
MATPDVLDNRRKAVVAFLDGRRLKGYIRNFSAQQVRFRVYSEQESEQNEGTDVQMKDLKAIFFARDPVGGSGHAEPQTLASRNQGRRAEVLFRDSEKLVGTTDAYDPQGIGFFLVPTDPRSNNLRVFVITKNVTQIHWI